MIIVIITLVIVCIILSLNLYKKKELDRKAEKEYIEKLDSLSLKCEQLTDTRDQLNESIARAKQYYKDELDSEMKTMTLWREEFQKEKDAAEAELREKKKTVGENLLLYRENEKSKIDKVLEDYQKETDEKILKMRDEYGEALVKQTEFTIAAQDLKVTYQNLLEPLKNLEKEENELLFYTIQVPTEDRADISYLMNNVIENLSHPDILRKLIWSEFVQKPTNDLMARAQITDEPGIYKITNIHNKKCYIGKAVNVKKRLIEHIKGALNISSIADQQVHHIMAEEGIWNFTFEKICSCDKSSLSEKEKYYIDFFDSQSWGYNQKAGG